MNFNKKIIPLVLAATLTQSIIPQIALASTITDPQQGAYGFFVDTYKNNTTSNLSPTTNPTIGVLSQYLNLWTPGASWDNGTILNTPVHNANNQKVIDMTKNRTETEAHQTYLDDRRDQNYSITDGLGKYTDAFRVGAGAGTTITDNIPPDATQKKYDDKGNSNGKWAETNSNLGNMVNLINVLRNSSASTTPAKTYFQYKRPWRWSNDVQVLPTLIPAKSTTPEKDGGFPSGHTNAATLSALGLAYAVPERFQEIITRASELGNNRIVAGMHSPLDVMGGRMTATAIAAAALNNADNKNVKLGAYDDAHTKLLTQNGTSVDRFSDYSKNKKNYTDRLTYGFAQIGDKNKPMTVPKGAEVLLETRLPYLDAQQRRTVLYTTGIQSGYPLLDDTEGWGRLNLYAAADSYGAFLDKVVVTMDASKGGFNAMDSWRNDISGSGNLTKNGTGTLKLTGANTYSGGTEVVNGTLEADSVTAFGTGKVTNNGGTITENVPGEVIIGSEYVQAPNGTLELNISSKADLIKIVDKATFGGTLKLNFLNNYIPADGSTILTYKPDARMGEFSSLVTTGLPKDYTVSVSYNADNVTLKVNNGQVDTTKGTNTNTNTSANTTDTNTDTNTTASNTTTTDITPAATDNNTATDKANLPQTGSIIDNSFLGAIGLLLVSAGLTITFKRKNRVD
jgi:LPXTG-motif cell wall-anchored protein